MYDDFEGEATAVFRQQSPEQPDTAVAVYGSSRPV